MKNQPFPIMRRNPIPPLGGLARATNDLLVSNPSTRSILRLSQEDIVPTEAATTVTDPNPPPGTAAHRIAVKPGSS